jgi:TolA-binding protein
LPVSNAPKWPKCVAKYIANAAKNSNPATKKRVDKKSALFFVAARQFKGMLEGKIRTKIKNSLAQSNKKSKTGYPHASSKTMTVRPLLLAVTLIYGLWSGPKLCAGNLHRQLNCPPAPWQLSLAQAYKNGIASYQKKDYNRAISEFKIYQASQLEPGATNYYLGLCYYQLKDFPQATRAFEDVLRQAHVPEEAHFAQIMLKDIETRRITQEISPKAPARAPTAQENQKLRLRQALNKRVEQEALAIIDSATQRSQKILDAAKLEINEVQKLAQEELERMENRNVFVSGYGILPGFTEDEKRAVWQKAHQKMETIRACAKEESDEILQRAKLNAKQHLAERLLTEEHQFVRSYKR